MMMNKIIPLSTKHKATKPSLPGRVTTTSTVSVVMMLWTSGCRRAARALSTLRSTI